MSDAEPPRNPFEGFRVEIDPERVEDALRKLRERLERAQAKMQRGVGQSRHVKVRLAHRGRPIGPDIPLPLFLAGQGVALAWLGPMMVLLGNLGAKAFLDVVFVHEADEKVAEGNEAYTHGDVEAAERCYRDALEMRADDPAALYHLGVLLRVTGRQDEAEASWRQAAMGPEGHPSVVRAAEALDRLKGRRTL